MFSFSFDLASHFSFVVDLWTWTFLRSFFMTFSVSHLSSQGFSSISSIEVGANPQVQLPLLVQAPKGSLKVFGPFVLDIADGDTLFNVLSKDFWLVLHCDLIVCQGCVW